MNHRCRYSNIYAPSIHEIVVMTKNIGGCIGHQSGPHERSGQGSTNVFNALAFCAWLIVSDKHGRSGK